MSFVVQAAELEHGSLQHKHLLFVPALATVLEVVGLNKVHMSILELYAPFLKSYNVEETHETKHLQWLFRLSEKIKGNISWLVQA